MSKRRGFWINSFTLVAVAIAVLVAARERRAEAQATGVTIQNFAYMPMTVTVPAGGSVTWTQRDTVAHTVTSGTPGGSGTGSVFNHTLSSPGDTFTFTFTEAGTFAYFCTFHPFMLGTVQAGSGGATPAPSPRPSAPVSVQPAAATGGPPNATAVATGLRNPRGFTFAPDGSIYVAESGTQPASADPTAVSPANPLYSTTGRVSRIASDGTVSTVADNLPSIVQFNGEPIGPTAVAWVPDVFWLLLSKNGDEGRADVFTGVYGINDDGTVTLLADLEAYNKANPPRQIPPDNAISNPYDMIALNGKLYITDGNAGVVFEVDPTLGPESNTRHLADLSTLGAGGGQPVLTGIAAGSDGNLYVTNLTKAPFPAGGANVWRITLDGQVTQVAGGVTAGTGIAVASDGTFYISEIGQAGTLAQPGRIVTVAGSGVETFASPVTAPTMLRTGPDGALYVSFLSAYAPGGGADGGIYRIPLSAASAE